MNIHLNLFNNFREDKGTIENNLTRAFIITLKKEPQLLRDFLFLLNQEYSWDDITVSLLSNVIDISEFETVIGLALTSNEISQTEIGQIQAKGTNKPTPDFLIYSSKTLIVGEVKKHSENPIGQLKNQLKYLIGKKSNKESTPEIKVIALSWTEVLRDLILPHEKFTKNHNVQTIWASEFKEYITTHYTDWLPDSPLDRLEFTTDESSIAFQFLEKRLDVIQSKTKFGKTKNWIGGRKTMSLNFGWATEAQVTLQKHNNRNFVRVTIWPADTKSQGQKIFNNEIGWTKKPFVLTPLGNFELIVYPYIKFSHIMGKWMTNIHFSGEAKPIGFSFHTKKNFYRFSKRWDRSQWNKLENQFDEEFSNKIDWRSASNWNKIFVSGGKNFVFISMGFECNIFIPFELFQKVEKEDPSGVKAAEILNAAIYNFRNLVNNL